MHRSGSGKIGKFTLKLQPAQGNLSLEVNAACCWDTWHMDGLVAMELSAVAEGMGMCGHVQATWRTC